MVIYMDQYRAVKTAPAEWLRNGTYGGAIMHAGQAAAVIPMMRATAEPMPSPELPADLADADVEALLARLHGLATLI